jgi:2-succinyl-6-hydroxy-2,4-cyclohexadiene-1-carboxylate synthase
LLGSSHEWRAIAPYFASWSSLAIDLPGHGNSTQQPCHGFADVSQLINATLRQHNITRYWLLGYSLGGRIAMYHACHGNHEGLQGIVIEGSHPGLNSETLRAQRRANDADWAHRFRTESIKPVLTDWYQQPVFADLPPQHRAALIEERANNHGPAIADMLEATSLGQQPWLVPQLQQLTLPLKAVCGSNDQKFQALALAAGLSLATVPHAGHNAHQANPAGFAAQLHKFFCS